MVVVEKMAREVERVISVREEPKIDIALLRKKSSAKTPSGLILSYLQKARKMGNLELSIFLQELYTQVIPLEKRRLAPIIEIEIVEGWKGKDTLQIWGGVQNDWVIRSHLKDKDTGKVSSSNHLIKNEDFNRILFFIKKWEIGESHKCYDFAEVLGFKKWKDLWREREIYFKKYYYCIKILEKLEIIHYSGRGVITRLK